MTALGLIKCNANLCCRSAALHVEDPRLGEDAAVEGPQARVCPAFYLVSVLLFYYNTLALLC